MIAVINSIMINSPTCIIHEMWQSFFFEYYVFKIILPTRRFIRAINVQVLSMYHTYVKITGACLQEMLLQCPNKFIPALD